MVNAMDRNTRPEGRKTGSSQRPPSEYEQEDVGGEMGGER